MVIHRPNYKGIPPDRDIIFLASGGRDSTAMVLEAYDQGLVGSLLFSDTKFNKRGKDNVIRLAKYTNYDLFIVTYQGEETPIGILNQSFKNIPIILKRIKDTGRFQRNYFYCCYKLKHGPMNKKIDELSNIPLIQVLGIKGTDGNIHRRLRMGELRKKDQFYRIKADGSMFWYPLRDCSDTDVSMILDEHNFSDVKHSGCSLCPILCLNKGSERKDPEAYTRSMRKGLQMGVIERENYDLGVFCK